MIAEGRITQGRKKYDKKFPYNPDTFVPDPNRVYNVTLRNIDKATTRLAVIDLDNHTADPVRAISIQAGVALITKKLRAEGQEPFAIRSGGGHGVHVLLRWDKPQNVAAVHRMLQEAAGNYTREVYPTSSIVGFGKSIDLPLQRKSVPITKGAWKASKPVPDTWVQAGRAAAPIGDKWRDPALAAECLKRIPASNDRMERRAVLMAAKRAGAELDDFLTWRQPENNDARRNAERSWKEFKEGSPGYGLPWLISQAQLADPTFRPPPRQGDKPSFVLQRVMDISLAKIYPRPLVHGLLEYGSTGLIYGPSGGGKTLFAVSLSCSVAAGQPFFGKEVVKAPVAYFAVESPRSVIARVRAWLYGNPGAISGIAENFFVCTYPVVLTPKGDKVSPDAALMINKVNEIGAGLVILDTLSKIVPGADENSSVDMTLVMDALIRVSRETDACVLLVHHTGKDMDKGVRGASVIGNAVEERLLVVDSYSERKGRTEFTAEKVHSKDGEVGVVGHFIAQPELVMNAPVKGGEPWISVWASPINEVSLDAVQRENGGQSAKQRIARQRKPDSATDVILQALEGGKELTRKGLLAVVGKESTLRTALHRLRRDGLIDEDGGRVRLG